MHALPPPPPPPPQTPAPHACPTRGRPHCPRERLDNWGPRGADHDGNGLSVQPRPHCPDTKHKLHQPPNTPRRDDRDGPGHDDRVGWRTDRDSRRGPIHQREREPSPKRVIRRHIPLKRRGPDSPTTRSTGQPTQFARNNTANMLVITIRSQPNASASAADLKSNMIYTLPTQKNVNEVTCLESAPSKAVEPAHLAAQKKRAQQKHNGGRTLG